MRRAFLVVVLLIALGATALYVRTSVLRRTDDSTALSDGPAPPATGAPAAADPVLRVPFDEAKQHLDSQLAALRKEYAAAARPATTAADIGAVLRHDPYACWAFVRRALRYEPSAGILRDPDSTLAAGGGNSADLALLLAAMIKGGPDAVQFAVAELTDEQAGVLVERAAGAAPASAAVAAADLSAMPAIDAGPADAAAGDLLKSEGAELTAVLDAARASQRQLASLVPPPAASMDAATAAARRHVWVQVRRGQEVISLDPVAGQLLPDNAQVMSALPAGWHHRVEVRLDVEKLDSGRLKRRPLVTADWPTTETDARAIEVIIVPDTLSGADIFDPAVGSRSFVERARGARIFTAAVLLGGDAAQRTGRFDLHGDTPAERPSGLLSSVPDPFGRFKRPAPTPATTAAPSGLLTAVTLTITLRGPGGVSRTVERMLFDRIGPAARDAGSVSVTPKLQDPLAATLALVQRHEILAPVGRIGSDRVARDALNTIVEGDTLERTLALRYGRDADKPSGWIENLRLPLLPTELIEVSDSALSLAAASLAGRGIVYLAEPNLYIRSETLRYGAGGSVTHRLAVDIASNRVAVLGEPAAAAQARALHGTLASELEAGAVQPGSPREVRWAAAALRAARAKGGEFRVVRAARDLDALGGDADVRAVMARQLAAGDVIVAPARLAEIPAWWRVDRDGHVLAIGPDGTGQVASEGVLVLKEISIPSVKRTMTFVKCFNLAIGGGQSMNSAGAECLSQAIQDQVKSTLDKAIDQFVKNPINSAIDEGRAQMLGEEYEKLYQQAKKAWETFQKAQALLDDPIGETVGNVPGVQEGQAAADAGRQIGAAFGFRLYLYLTMGSDIAAYASKVAP